MALPGAPVRPFSLDEPEQLPPEYRGPASYPVTDDDREEAYATFSRQLLEEQKDVMDPLFLTWTQNLLFLAGLQWWEYDSATGTFRLPNAPKWKERPVRNLILPYFKNIVAKATKNRPVTQCVPGSTDADDIEASQLGDDVLRAKWEELSLSEVMRAAVGWAVTTGNAWLMPYWNTHSGQIQPLTTLVEGMKYDEMGVALGAELVECPCDETGEPLLDEQGNFAIGSEPAYVDIGDVNVKVLSPFQVFVDPDATCESDVTFYLIAEPMTLRRIRQMWPEVINVQAEDVTDFDRFDAMLSGVVAGADTHITAGRLTRDQSVQKGLVLHYYERPTNDHPQGRYWCTAGQSLLEEPGPLPGGIWPPVAHMKEVDVPGRFHGDATMTAMIGPQREYNESTSRIKQHEKLMLVGKWLVPRGSGVKRGQITAKEGEVIEHTPGLAPKMAEIKDLPNGVYQERERTAADVEMIGGFHRISMGSPPPGVKSGRAFLTLQEADDSDLGPFINRVEDTTALVSWLLLQFIQKFYKTERLLRIAGHSRRFIVKSFQGADLDAVVDVIPVAGSAFPWSAVAKQSMMVDLATAVPPLFTDPETGMFDAERFRRLLPVGGMESIGAESDIDTNEALREEEAIEGWDGSPESPLPVPLPWQNHIAHFKQHTRTLRDGSTDTWPPHAREAMIAHWGATQMEVQAIMAAQAAMAQQEAGGEGGDKKKPPGRAGESYDAGQQDLDSERKKLGGDVTEGE